MSHTEVGLGTLDAARLTAVVARALDQSGSVETTAWKWTPLTGGVGGQGVYRVSGSALVDGETTEWSVVLKVLRPGESDAEPESESYWLREREVIRSSLLDGLQDGVSAPRCLAIEDLDADETWLWFEDVRNDMPHPWPTGAWVDIARQFGRWQGEYLVGKTLPSYDWLRAGWLERCFVNFGPPCLSDDLPQPVLSRLYPDDCIARIERFWVERDTYLSAFRRLPLTVAHLDADGRNLFLRGGRAVVIDWAFTSLEPAGSDLLGLVVGSIFTSGEVPPDEHHTFDQAVFQGYLAGLRQAGWRGDARTIRFAFLVATCFRLITVLGSTARMLAQDDDHSFWGVMATLLGTADREETIQRWACGNQFLAECADEARRLV